MITNIRFYNAQKVEYLGMSEHHVRTAEPWPGQQVVIQ